MSELDRRTFLTRTAGGLIGFALLPELVRARTPRLPREEPLLVGLVGLGRHARDINLELQSIEHARVAAICDTDAPRLEAFKRRAPGAEPFTSIDQLLAKRPDITCIVVATPTNTHREVVERVLADATPRHVYCEAPIAHTVEDCVAIVRAGQNAEGVVCAAGLQNRSNPVYKRAWSLNISGGLEELVALRAQRHERSTWRSPVTDPAREKALNWRLDPERSIGLAGEWGTHQFDLFHWMVGDPPTKVRAHGSIRLHDDGRTIHDTVATDLFFDDLLLQHSATLCSAYEHTYETLAGTAGAIKLAGTHAWFFKEADAPTMGWEVYATRQQFHDDEGIILIADATKLAAQGKLKEGIGLPHTPLHYALADFLACVADATNDPDNADAQPASTFADGANATAIGIAANTACVSGDTINIVMPEF